MKAITVRQPWAWAIIYGGKNVENRPQPWRYRGPLAIHAGVRISMRGQQFAPLKQAWQAWTAEHGRPDPYWPTGAVIGLVAVVDCHEENGCCAPWGERSVGDRKTMHLVLEDPYPLPEPIPMRGGQGLWKLPPGVLG
jgi:hypothetical protein